MILNLMIESPYEIEFGDGSRRVRAPLGTLVQ